jgi:hypothetical protein
MPAVMQWEACNDATRDAVFPEEVTDASHWPGWSRQSKEFRD